MPFFRLFLVQRKNDFLRPLSVISWECSACNLLNLLTLGFWDLICHWTTCLYLCGIWISEKPRSQARKGTSSVGHQMQYQYWRNWKLEKNIKCWMKNCSDDKTWENLALLPTTAFPTNRPTQASPLSELQSHGRHIHGIAGTPLGAELGAKRKSKMMWNLQSKRRTNASCWPEALMRLSQYFIAREGSHHRLWYTLFWACSWIYLEGALSKLRRAKYAVKHLFTLADDCGHLFTRKMMVNVDAVPNVYFLPVFLIHRISEFSMNFLLDVFRDLWFPPLSFCDMHEEKFEEVTTAALGSHCSTVTCWLCFCTCTDTAPSGMLQACQVDFFPTQMGRNDAKFKSIQRRHVSKAEN